MSPMAERKNKERRKEIRWLTELSIITASVLKIRCVCVCVCVSNDFKLSHHWERGMCRKMSRCSGSVLKKLHCTERGTKSKSHFLAHLEDSLKTGQASSSHNDVFSFQRIQPLKSVFIISARSYKHTHPLTTSVSVTLNRFILKKSRELGTK